jgi:hypothetical protein
MSRKPITKWIIRTFGLPGSWKWALRQMSNGKIVRNGSPSPVYRICQPSRIMWSYCTGNKACHFQKTDFRPADFYLYDFDSVEWEVLE